MRARLTLEICTSETTSIQFNGRRIQHRLLTEYGGIPPECTLLHTLARRHGLIRTPEMDDLARSAAPGNGGGGDEAHEAA
jgi:hypothetical protein